MDDDYDQNGGDDSYGSSYNAKIMFASGAILVSACIAVVLFHLFIRRRTRRADPLADHHLPRRRLSILLDTPAAAVRQGLDARVLNSIPTFTYDLKAHENETPLVCAVCLSEFEDGETGRVLPKCEHCFHLDCIGTWLRTHGDCPLCRARVRVGDRVRVVEPGFQDAPVAITTADDKASPENRSSVVVSIGEAEAGDQRERS